MIYIVNNNKILGCFSTRNKAMQYLIDYLLIKFETLYDISYNNFIKINLDEIINEMHINSYEIDDNTLIESIKLNNLFDFIHVESDEKIIIDNKLILNKVKTLISLNNHIKERISNNTSDIFVDSNSTFNLSSLNDSDNFSLNSINSEKISNIFKDSKNIEHQYSNNEQTDCLDNNSDKKDENLEDEEKENIKLKINDLNSKRIDFEKKIELLRKFEVDYKNYFEIKNKFKEEEVPIIFKNAYKIFKQLDDTNLINNKKKCKSVYLKKSKLLEEQINTENYSYLFENLNT